MAYDSFEIRKKLVPEIVQKKDVIFFGGLDRYSFEISYRLYRLKIKHDFVIYNESLSLQIVDVRTLNGFDHIVKYLDSFKYILDIS